MGIASAGERPMAEIMRTSLRPMSSFGDVAAEEDSVLDYFLTTDAAKRLARNEAFLVLGRKGSGKTALVRHFSEGAAVGLAKPLGLRGYPWTVHATRIDLGASPIEAYVSSWRYLIAVQMASLVLAAGYGSASAEGAALARFLEENYGGITPEIAVILRPSALKLSKLSFEPTVLGNKLGGIALERPNNSMGLELDALSQSILKATLSLATKAGIEALTLHFDELDQGLSQLDDNRKIMLIGLILAARSIRLDARNEATRVNAVVYLRSDIWGQLEFSDKNKISQSLAINLEWSSQSLLELINNRISAKLGDGVSWDNVIDEGLIRGSQSKWSHVLARTFLRPRDVIKFLNAALAEAKKRADEPLVFENRDIVGARDPFSIYLKQELDDEILPHWSRWEEALQACAAISTLTFERENFKAEYEKRKSSDNSVDSDNALRLLYQFSVIGYERRSGYGGSYWSFQYEDQQSGWDSSATRFKVHLGLKEFARLREERQR